MRWECAVDLDGLVLAAGTAPSSASSASLHCKSKVHTEINTEIIYRTLTQRMGCELVGDLGDFGDLVDPAILILDRDSGYLYRSTSSLIVLIEAQNSRRYGTNSETWGFLTAPTKSRQTPNRQFLIGGPCTEPNKKKKSPGYQRRGVILSNTEKKGLCCLINPQSFSRRKGIYHTELR